MIKYMVYCWVKEESRVGSDLSLFQTGYGICREVLKNSMNYISWWLSTTKR